MKGRIVNANGRSVRLWMAGWLLASAVASAESDALALASSFFVFRMTLQVEAEAAGLAREAGGEAAAEIEAAAAAWAADVTETVRTSLEARFGDSARGAFGEFVSAFTAAEAESDAAYLARLSDAMGWRPAPADFDGFRRRITAETLQKDIDAAGELLGEIQTWIDLRSRGERTPSLRAWLDRSSPPPTPADPPAAAAPPRRSFRPANPLRDAEAAAGEFHNNEAEEGSPLDAFGDARAARRQRAMDEAQAGMQQVAEERRAAEEEFAAKKLSAAQAEAEAVKKQAEKLAAAEKEAIEQRKNSWSGRVKQIVSATIGAAGGAFFGGVGSRAGEAAAEAIFKN